MNSALLRASLFAEENSGAARGSVVSTDEVAYRQGLVEGGRSPPAIGALLRNAVTAGVIPT